MENSTIINKEDKRIAVFPGAFDPITNFHKSIVLRAMDLFDEIWVAIWNNPDKHSTFYLTYRENWCEKVFEKYPKVKVCFYSDLTIDLCKRLGARYIIRGLRNCNNFECESMIYHAGKYIAPDYPVETIFFIAENQYAGISSSLVREIYRNNGDYAALVPREVELPNK